MGQIILQVVIVLGIIIAGGFLIFFLGDLLMSIVDPKRDNEKVMSKKRKEAEKLAERIDSLPAEVKQQVLKDENVVDVLNSVEKKNEQVTPVQPQANVQSYVVEAYEQEDNKEETEEQASASEENEQDDEEARIAEARAALERRKQEILRRIQSQMEDNEEENDEEDEEDVETKEESTEEDIIEEPAVVEESEEEKALRAELEKAKSELEAEKARYAELAKQIAESKENETEEVVTGPALPKEEYEKQLAELQERLSANEKELRACKKEYLPLARIAKTLEKDEKKLRRKEAVVAKQKMMVYGVNNYADIDEEKAKKLAEELDLYDGLKLSVQNCRDVMENNNDRFTVLEKMYYILKAQNEQLKNDILEIQQALESFKEEE